MTILRNTDTGQARNCRLWLQIGTTAYVFGNPTPRNGLSYYGTRVEIGTPSHAFRVRLGKWAR